MVLQKQGNQILDDLVLFHDLLASPGIAELLTGAGTASGRDLLTLAGTRQLRGDLRVAALADGLLLLENSVTRLLASTALADLPADFITAAVQELSLLQQVVLARQDLPAYLLNWPGEQGCVVDGELFISYRDALIANFDRLTPQALLSQLATAYHTLGVGSIARFTSFRWEGELAGVSMPDPITLADLVGCEQQKTAILENTEGFLRYRKGNNILLYGERGTGKSSMIKAVANAYRTQGLCLIEMGQSKVESFRLLLEQLRQHPQKNFIVYLDDLSFDRGDSNYRSFKAILDGGAAAIPANVLLYATSNRRHLVHESWQDRQGPAEEVRTGDTMAEKLSLSDRFGMTLVFASPAQEEYLTIVRAIAAKEKINLPDGVLCKEALEWTMWQNARSGRTARQFINHLLGQGKR